MIQLGDKFVIGHKLPRATHPQLTWSWANLQLEHGRCSNQSGPRVALDAAYTRGYEAGYADAGAEAQTQSAASPHTNSYGDATSTAEPVEAATEPASGPAHIW